MPRRCVVQSIAAGAQYDPFADYQYRYLPWRGSVRLMAWSSAVGVTLQVRSGSEEIQVVSPIDIGGAAGNLPSAFDVDPLDFVAPAGDLISALFTNTTAGALSVGLVLDINPA